MGGKKRVYDKDIAISVMSVGSREALMRYRLSPARAKRVADIIKASGAEVPDLLQELADRTRHGSSYRSGPMPGDERTYMTTDNSRVSVDTSVIGVGPKEPVHVVFHADKIVVSKPKDGG